MSDLEKLREAWRRGGFRGILRGMWRRAFLRTVELIKSPLNRDTSRDPVALLEARYREMVAARGPSRVLEIGGRARSGTVASPIPGAHTVVFDIKAGPNVDVVGDAHRLSAHFEPHSFDAAFAIAVFEHLAMPWKVVLEVNRVLKPGGLLLIVTHPTFPPHDRPWDFWRYSRDAFRVLLNQRTGFELVECEEGMPCRVIPLGTEPWMVGLWREPAYLVVAALARKSGDASDRLTWDVTLEEILDSSYPA